MAHFASLMESGAGAFPATVNLVVMDMLKLNLDSPETAALQVSILGPLRLREFDEAPTAQSISVFQKHATTTTSPNPANHR